MPLEHTNDADEIRIVHETYDYELLLREINNKLKEKERLLFEAIYIDKTPVKTLAAQMQLSTAAIYLRKARLERKLRAILQESKPDS